MRKDMDVIYVYNLVDSNGNKLQLRLGRYRNTECIPYNGDQGFRWSFVGHQIPMPIRSETWFNGFPENIMLDWLKGNGWYPRTRVNMSTGRVLVYELPKGSEEDIRILPERHEHEECVFRSIIRDLASNGKKMRAAALYRYANGGEIRDAYNAVMEICDEA